MPTSENEVYLPVLLNITGKKILMIGAGAACREKLWSLGQIKTKVTVIAPEIHDDFLDKPWVTILKRKYQKQDLEGVDIIYVGVNNPELDAEILRDAREHNILVNFVDKKEYSDFISPSVLQRENFSIFISTFGRGPGAAKMIRQEIEKNIDLGKLDSAAGEYILKRKKS